MKSNIEKKNEDVSLVQEVVAEIGGAQDSSSFEIAQEPFELPGIPEPMPMQMPRIDLQTRRLHMMHLHGLGYETCGRAGELLKARWEDFDLAARSWLILAANNKNRRARVVPLTVEAVRLLVAMQPLSDPLNPRVFHALTSTAFTSKAFHSMMLQMGLPCRNFSELRRLAIKCLEGRSHLTEVEICHIVDRPLTSTMVKGSRACLRPDEPRA